MAYEIRALSLGEMLDAGLRLVRDHFRVLVGVAAVLYVPLALVSAPFAATAVPSDPQAAVMAAGIAFLLALLAMPVVMAAVTHALGEVYLGRGVTVGRSLRTGLALLLPLMGTWLLASLLILAAGAVFGAAVWLAIASPSWPFRLLAVVAVVLPILVMLRFLLLTQVMVIERVFGPVAMRRASEVIRGHVLRGLGVLAVGGILTSVLTFGVELAVGWIPWVGPLGSGLAQAVGLAFTSALSVLLYFDIRCRKEAFDLEHLSRLVEERAQEPAPRAP